LKVIGVMTNSSTIITARWTLWPIRTFESPLLTEDLLGQNKEVGMDLEKFKQAVGGRWNVINAVDYDAYRNEAMKGKVAAISRA
jgi:hypothetical protein